MREQWYGGTEGSLWDSLQSPPGLMGWEGLWDSSGMVGLPSVPARTQGMGRTLGQQWYGGTQGKGRTMRQQWYDGTEGSLWDSVQSPPGLRGWEGLWDSSGMVGLTGVIWTPFSSCQDSGNGKDLGR